MLIDKERMIAGDYLITFSLKSFNGEADLELNIIVIDEKLEQKDEDKTNDSDRDSATPRDIE